MQDGPILTGESVREYFRQLFVEARTHQRLEVDDATEFYLVNLLAERTSLIPGAEEPLALILKNALEARGGERVRALRQLGDTSLWVSGFFSDHVDTQVVDVSYYIGMGHHAYGSLSRLTRAQLGTIYGELAAKFSRLVDVLNEMSERAALTSERGLLRLYERFRRTGSVRIARLLAEKGLMPISAAKGVQ